jgi:FlaA1/EpsC-like NDP-sugar epimerase
MARTLIRLSGLTPDEDIRLTTTGLRPGEKLFEELVGATETVQPSSIEKVFEVTSHRLPTPEWLDAQVRRLEHFARHGNSTAVMQMLSHILPEYRGRSWDPLPAEAPTPPPVHVAAQAGVLGSAAV